MSRTTDLVQNYVSDALALERHLVEAFERQAHDESLRRFPDALAQVQKIHRLGQRHLAALTNQLEALGGHPTATVKETVTAVLGMAAGLLDKVRPFSASKMLRDDYAALSMAAISYTMLHTTALALGEGATAGLAKQHLQDWTPAIVEISQLMPFLVVKELQENSVAINPNAADEALKNTHQTWTREAIGRAA